MRNRWKIRLCIFVLGIVASHVTQAEDRERFGAVSGVLGYGYDSLKRQGVLPSYGDGFLTFYLDNDLFAGTDEGYTNGARISWVSGSRSIEEFGRIQRGLRNLVGDEKSYGFFRGVSGFDADSEIGYNIGFSLTQLMFTPESLTASSAPEGQRPYAGWLGLGYSLHAKDEDTLNSVELTLGIIGPSALAEQTQDLVHDIRGFERFQGWDSQLPDEPTLNLQFTQKRLLKIPDITRHFRTDGLLEWGFSAGNFRTNAFGGMIFRGGYNLPAAFSDPRLAENAYSHVPFETERSYAGSWSLYGLTGFQLRGVLFDATLDGPLFRDIDTGVDPLYLVGELYAGFGVRFRDAEFSYVHTFRTREFRQDENDYVSFGSVALRLRF